MNSSPSTISHKADAQGTLNQYSKHRCIELLFTMKLSNVSCFFNKNSYLLRRNINSEISPTLYHRTASGSHIKGFFVTKKL